MPIRLLLFVFFLSLGFGAVPALALYRGDEITVRSYEMGSMFFINRLTYEPWQEQMDRFHSATNAYIGAAGSLRGNDLYLFHHLRIRQPVADSFALKLDYVRDRDFDGAYQRFQMGLAWEASPRWTLALVGEPTPDKEDADIGLAIAYTGGRVAGRVQVLYPGFVYNGKNPDDATMQRAPNIQVEGHYQPAPGWVLYVEGDIDPPRRLVNPMQSFRFDFEKYQGEVGVRHLFSSDAQWRGALKGEYTRKLRQGLAKGDGNAFSEEREAVQARFEYLRRLERDAYFRAGALYVFFDEQREYPFFAEDDLFTDRQDHILYAGRSWPLRDQVQLNTLLLLNGLSHQWTREDPEESGSTERLVVRTAASLIFYGAAYQIETGAAYNVDQARFGGGFVKVFADF